MAYTHPSISFFDDNTEGLQTVFCDTSQTIPPRACNNDLPRHLLPGAVPYVPQNDYPDLFTICLEQHLLQDSLHTDASTASTDSRGFEHVGHRFLPDVGTSTFGLYDQEPISDESGNARLSGLTHYIYPEPRPFSQYLIPQSDGSEILDFPKGGIFANLLDRGQGPVVVYPHSESSAALDNSLHIEGHPQELSEDPTSRTLKCEWIDNGLLCNSFLESSKPCIVQHLHNLHNFRSGDGKKMQKCCWGNCSKLLKKESIARHILTVHLRVTTTCEACGSTFARDDSLRRHKRNSRGACGIQPSQSIPQERIVGY